ncbi:hypothetical protein Dimus_008758 [Dionaea muscipula]
MLAMNGCLLAAIIVEVHCSAKLAAGVLAEEDAAARCMKGDAAARLLSPLHAVRRRGSPLLAEGGCSSSVKLTRSLLAAVEGLARKF